MTSKRQDDGEKRVMKVFRLRPETVEILARLSKEMGISQRKLVERAVLKMAQERELL